MLFSANVNDDVFAFPDDSTPKKVKSTNNQKQQAATKPRSRRISSSSAKASISSARVSILIYVKMSTVMGFTWLFGLFSAIFPDLTPLRYIFELLVPLQGFFIFVAFICKKRIFELYKGLSQGKKRKDTDFRRKIPFAAKSKPTSPFNSGSKSEPNLARSFHLQFRFSERVRHCSSSESICPFTRRIASFPGETNLAYESEINQKSRSSSESSQDNKL